ncbi:MAG TPA: FAD-dependent oxidoreductase [Candidatus Merdicola faecigallinarum]|uniref:FAD-dependent oxidoreductase n=1 Tax=Candidatus Merdicola faecigallinarum TaxID=2840862 RepID=A0A9D1M1K7_9FIRM|nr:FAD-dependent oxidoreductase [Candidatus Merdicola faecigallinarum]
MENREEQIAEYTNYCLNCKVKPCQKGCPLENDIPNFIQSVKNNKIEEAFQTLIKTTVLGSLCGRICPHFKQCQGSCVRGIKGNPVSIGEVEAYVFDKAIEKGLKINKEINESLKGKKVAIIGSGPSSLTAAAFLAREGITVTIYEKQEKLGGILRYGIPSFRLGKEILDKTINIILELGIKVKTEQNLEENLFLSDLEKEYDAVFLGIGANKSSKMEIEGEELKGVYGGNELLEKGIHPNYTGKKVAVIGGGNVAMDTARTIKRMGAEKVFVIYRRAEEQMPAEKKEIEEAKVEGIKFLFQNNIVKIIGNEKQEVEKIECIKTELVQKEGEVRKSPVNIIGSNYEMEMDYVVMAVGSKTDRELLSTLDMELTNYGYLKVNEKYQTSKKKIFAGGDLIGTKATVAWAARSGREAAKEIKEFLLLEKE